MLSTQKQSPSEGAVLPGVEPGQEGLSGLAEVAVAPCKGSLGNALKREDSGGWDWALLRLQSMKR